MTVFVEVSSEKSTENARLARVARADENEPDDLIAAQSRQDNNSTQRIDVQVLLAATINQLRLRIARRVL